MYYGRGKAVLVVMQGGEINQVTLYRRVGKDTPPGLTDLCIALTPSVPRGVYNQAGVFTHGKGYRPSNRCRATVQSGIGIPRLRPVDILRRSGDKALMSTQSGSLVTRECRDQPAGSDRKFGDGT
jgi:hypothetical protein